MLKDADIRTPLHRWLTHANSHDARILHELKMPRPSARIDIAVVNGHLCGFEIKSDRDTLRRLPQQIRGFNSVFEKIFIVTTEKHRASVLDAVPSWWGIVVCQDFNGFKVHRRAKINRNIIPSSLVYLLTNDEIIKFLNEVDPHGVSGKLCKAELVDLAQKRLGIRALARYVREALKNRGVVAG